MHAQTEAIGQYWSAIFKHMMQHSVIEIFVKMKMLLGRF